MARDRAVPTLLLRAVRRQRARPAMRAKGQFWGSVITDDEVDVLLQAHGEIDLPPNHTDGLESALNMSICLRDDAGRFGKFGSFDSMAMKSASSCWFSHPKSPPATDASLRTSTTT